MERTQTDQSLLLEKQIPAWSAVEMYGKFSLQPKSRQLFPTVLICFFYRVFVGHRPIF